MPSSQAWTTNGPTADRPRVVHIHCVSCRLLQIRLRLEIVLKLPPRHPLDLLKPPTVPKHCYAKLTLYPESPVQIYAIGVPLSVLVAVSVTGDHKKCRCCCR